MIGLALILMGLAGASPAGNASKTAEYEAARATFGTGADDQVRLALWCEEHGLEAERNRHLARAVLIDPSNTRARALLGQVADDRGHWHGPEAARGPSVARLAEYNGRRARMEDTADGHWKLALWCEQVGLGQEALAHFTTVTRLDPDRAAAWKRLGFRQFRGRWATGEEIAREKAESEDQARADRHWRSRLERLRNSLFDRDPDRRALSEREISGIDDARAVPAVLVVFSPDRSATGRWAVQILGQIDAPFASRALAAVAVSSDAETVRRAAIETLARRDAREFIDIFIARLLDPVRYAIRPTTGPGKPGELLIEGDRFDLNRVYNPPPLPVLLMSPGSRYDSDEEGFLMAHVANAVRGEAVLNSLSPALTWAMIDRSIEPRTVRSTPNRPGQFIVQNRDQTAPAQLPRVIAALLGPNSGLMTVPFILDPFAFWVASPDGLQTQAPVVRGSRIWSVNFDGQTATPQPPITVPIGRMAAEIEKTANQARGQQRDDAAVIDRHNAAVRKLNDRVLIAMASILGTNPGTNRSDVHKWWAETRGYAVPATPLKDRPTVVEDVSLEYTPATIGRFLFDREVGYFTPPTSSCFAAGTPVWTPSGTRPIETLCIGDRVLAQDSRTGALGFRPVVSVHHNPPDATLRLRLAQRSGGGETLAVTGIHRVWKARVGWVMVRELKPGDVVRALGGVVRVDAIDSGETLPVFNLEVAGSHDFFVGNSATLVHDYTVVAPVDEPFDAPGPATLASRTR